MLMLSYGIALVLMSTITVDRFRFHHDLFGNTLKSTFTVFRCLMGECSAPDGTPLTVALSEELGFIFDVAYIFMYVIVTFGISSLVVAIIVDSTMEAAKQLQYATQVSNWKKNE